MNFRLLYRPSSPASVSPYGLLDEQGREVPWANEFLDAQRMRGLSLCSLRAYGYDFLDFARWWLRPLAEITQSTLLDYLRTQLDRIPKPAPQTIYHRLSALRCVYRFHHGRQIPGPGGLTSTRAPRRCSPSNSRIFVWPKRRFASTAKETRIESCRCQRTPSRPPTTTFAWNGR